jgi:uncharacterized protein with PQ loop repeat
LRYAHPPRHRHDEAHHLRCGADRRAGLNYDLDHPCGATGNQESTMAPDPATPAADAAQSPTVMNRLLGAMSIFTLLMTVPQVLTIWVGHQAAGVSVVSWSAYLVSAVLWFWYGLQQRDRNIYLPCVGWVALDAAVIVGAVVYA